LRCFPTFLGIHDGASNRATPQYDTTHVYVAPEDFDRFVESLIATIIAWPGGAPTLRSAAWPIASLHDSLMAAKRCFMHSKIRPAPGLTPEHCYWISAPQASRTAEILRRAALRGSVKSSKCVLMHSASGPAPCWPAVQDFSMSRVHACMTETYWPNDGDTANNHEHRNSQISPSHRPPSDPSSVRRVETVLRDCGFDCTTRLLAFSKLI
jgi:hypothetical protein